MEKENEYLQKENEKLNQRSGVKWTDDFEELLEMYSTLSKNCLKLKEKENEMFENYISVCQEKEKIVVDTDEEIAHQRMKIKLLQEALTKRNQEFETLQNKNKRLVIYTICIFRQA